MNKFLLILVFSFVGLVSGQETKPYSTPAKSQISYSESTPYIPRQFPVVEKKKKEKPAKSNESKTDPSLVTNEVNQDSVIVPVTVFDSKGQIVSDLKMSEIEAFIDNMQAEILSIENNNEPLNIVLVFDLSPSTDAVFDTMKTVATRIVDHLKPEDRVMILGFNQETKLYLDITTDRTAITKAIKKMRMGDGTSLYNTVGELLQNRLAGISGPIATLIMTDGVDTTSRKASYESSLNAAEGSQVSFFPIYFDTYAANAEIQARNMKMYGTLMTTAPRNASGLGITKEEFALGLFYLNDLLSLSGGHTAPIADITSGKTWSIDIIPAEMRGRYYLKLRVADGGKVGDSHQIKVRVNRPNLTVLAKGSYIQK